MDLCYVYTLYIGNHALACLCILYSNLHGVVPHDELVQFSHRHHAVDLSILNGAFLLAYSWASSAGVQELNHFYFWLLSSNSKVPATYSNFND